MSAVANPEASFKPRPGDESLTPKQLEQISLFATLEKKPSFKKYPGTVVLRRYSSGDTIVRQGDAGWTAFYILTTEDVYALRSEQADTLLKQLANRGLAEANLERQAALERRLSACQAELSKLKRRQEEISTVDDAAARAMRQVATAHLYVNVAAKAARGGPLARIRSWFGGSDGGRGRAARRFIPNDGPADISLDTRQAPMYEGELFGEMSCMSRMPRSATVVADRDCYMLEILRNVLDQARKDRVYREQVDKLYRERALGRQLRNLSVFADLNDSLFAKIQSQAELLTFEPGQVICDEHDASDSFYVIRSGLVKVQVNLDLLLPAEFSPTAGWQVFCRELEDRAADAGKELWRQLPPAAQQSITRLAAERDGEKESDRREIVQAINSIIKGDGWINGLLNAKVELATAVSDPVAIAEFPAKPKDWPDLERREFNRLALESVCPRSVPRRRLTAGLRRTLRYMGRGEFFGEGGVMRDRPRSASCIAFNHPDSGQAVGGGAGVVAAGVEVVRIGREPFLEVCRATPALQSRVDAAIAARDQWTQAQVETAPWNPNQPMMLEPDFESLGLIQGQKLMLIDLDRCTRCGDCVRACIGTHDDGASRLFLDGPRFGKYLVPNACRKCRDPVCMIGCPVGSIVRGDDDEIQIKDWCIGCQLCAEQCPYGAIHMNLLEELRLPGAAPINADLPDESADTRDVKLRAVVCDMCSSLPSKEPACVYHCPHDAAIRIDARFEFPRA